MEYQTIVFKSNTDLFSSETEALNALRSMKFTAGEPVVAIYGSSWSEAKIILAIGKRNAAGDTAFSIIATSTDTDIINTNITSIETKISEHENVLANDSTPGHVISGGNIDYVDGIAYVSRLSHKLSFTGNTTAEFDASQDISVEIPVPSEALPLSNGNAASGTSDRWSREDHVHPVQTTISGNAGSASKLENSRTINIEGAVVGSASTDFSGDVTINTSVNHTHEIGDLTDIQDILDELDKKANIDSPNLEGTPTAPTCDPGTSTTQIATTEFVVNEIQSQLDSNVPLRYKGTLGTSGTITELPEEHTAGDTYVCISGSPSINGIPTEAGDLVVCIQDSTTANDSDWACIQTNLVTSVQTGQGLTGGGDLKDGITIAHQDKPSSGEEQGGSAAFVSKVYIDSLGHISDVEKTSITGTATAPSGSYLSEVWINGSTIQGSYRSIPEITVQNGGVSSNQYVTGISVGSENNSHSLVVSKASLVIPEIEITGGDSTSGQYVSGISATGHDIVVSKSDLPEESGKVKVNENGEADYLRNKLVDGETSGKVYGVNVNESSDKISFSVEVDEIDGSNNDQKIKLRRSNVPGNTGDGEIEEGEIFANVSDLYLYIHDGESVKRLYQDATTTTSGLLSAEDKVKIDLLSDSVGDINDLPSVIVNIQETISSEIDDVNNSISDLENRLVTEITERTNSDTEITTNLSILDNQAVKRIQLGEDGTIIPPTSGTVTIPNANTLLTGLMTPEDYEEVYTNIPKSIEDTYNSLMNLIVNLHASITFSANRTVIYKGESDTVTLSHSATFDGNPLTYTIKVDDSDISNPYTLEDSHTFTAVFSIDNDDPNVAMDITKTLTINAYYPRYYGYLASDSITEDDILTLGKQSRASSATISSLTVNFTTSGYLWLCVPSGMTISSVTSSGFAVPMESPVTIEVSGKGDYLCYRSTNEANAGSITYSIS